MASYTNLPVYNDCLKLLVYYEQLLTGMPRDKRFGVGGEVRAALIEVMVFVYKANKSVSGRRQNLQSALDYMVRAQILMRLMNELKVISAKQFMLMAEQTVNISKQLGAWEKKSKE